MIFVTVGTHEQQFNRLIETADNLVRDGKITEEVIMQTGYSTYKPKYCIWKSKFGLEEMKEMMNQAHIIITHGGPSSFMEALEKKDSHMKNCLPHESLDSRREAVNVIYVLFFDRRADLMSFIECDIAAECADRQIQQDVMNCQKAAIAFTCLNQGSLHV
jgi:hypothetical protein